MAISRALWTQRERTDDDSEGTSWLECRSKE